MWKSTLTQIDTTKAKVDSLIIDKNIDDAIDSIEDMRKELVKLSDDVFDTTQSCGDDQSPEKLKEVTKYVENISGKVGVVHDLEKRLDIMQNLDPLMDGILQKMS